MVKQYAPMDAPRGHILLVSAPWPLFNRPSLPLGALKAYLADTLPGVAVSACHLFLEVAGAVGYDRYQAVSRRVWRAESVFSALLYPHRSEKAERLYHRSRTSSDDAPPNFRALVDAVEAATDRWLASVDWTALDMVGFSVSFCQVTATLYLISRIKRIRPTLPVVVGGSSFSGAGAGEILELFPQIDYLVVGEGELPMVALLQWRLASCDGDSPPAMAAIVSRHASSMTPRFMQLPAMNRLPVPDFDDYFKVLSRFTPTARFFPTLPIEASRGCWWHRHDPEKEFKGCAFCNLNLQWHGYRTKAPQQVVREIEQLTGRYQVLSLAFADNAFPLKAATSIFEGLRSQRQLSIFTELRADTPVSLLPGMRAAGIDTVQIGIEALSTRLLKKMNKGTRAIDNICLMKHCLANGIENASNLMLHFPSSDAEDVAETLAVLDTVKIFHPLKTVSFWLGRGSPVHRNARRFHIRAVCPHPNLNALFPAAIARRFPFMLQGYRGDRGYQQRLWRPVQRKVRQWTVEYAELMRQTGWRPALAYRDGRDFLIIEQHRCGQAVERHRLTGDSAMIYRCCDLPRAFDQVAGAFGGHDRATIHSFLEMMVAKRLMVVEADHFLSLAVPVR